jgi:DNA-binding LytR/AlgR family response regulator
MIYTYIIIDDEKMYRDQVKERVFEFNTECQAHFQKTFAEEIKLELLSEHTGFTNNLPGQLREANLIFLDLHFVDQMVGLDWLANMNNNVLQSIVVLTNYKADLEKEHAKYPRVIDWLHKPLSIENLIKVVDQYHVQRNNLRAVFRGDHVNIIARNVGDIYYNDIRCVKSGGGDVTIYFVDGNSQTFNANVVAVRDFDRRQHFRLISTSCAINLSLPWTLGYDNDIGNYARLGNFNLLHEEERKIGRAYGELMALIAMPVESRIAKLDLENR